MKSKSKLNPISLINVYEILNIFGIKREIIFPQDLNLSSEDEKLMESHLRKSMKKFVNGKLSFDFLKNEFFPEHKVHPNAYNYYKMRLYVLREKIG